MYNIYGKLKDEDKYKAFNVNSMYFVDKKIHASLISDYKKADKLCMEFEELNPEYFFEVRSV